MLKVFNYKSIQKILNLQACTAEKRTVAVAQETETVTERIVVDRPPVPVDKCRDQEDQCTLRLMEIGHEHVNDTETETGNYDDARIGFQFIKAVSSRYFTIASRDSLSV